MRMNQDEVQAHPGHAGGQMQEAIATHQPDPDGPGAEGKVAAWARVLRVLHTGVLKMGSREPVTDAPPWATPRMMTGGFDSGELAAGGSLLPHEEATARAIGAQDGQVRQELNEYFLGEAGLQELNEMLESGDYHVQVPEEGALLVVAWLVAHDDHDAAQRLLAQIVPHFSRLRFYPIPHACPVEKSAVMHLQDVGRTLDDLRCLSTRPAIETMRTAVRVWNPFFDRLVAMFVETVEGPLPTLRVAQDGSLLRGDLDRRPLVEGGWPCQHYPGDWTGRARKLLEEYGALARRHKAGGRFTKGAGAHLLKCMETCIAGPSLLTGRDVGRVRQVIAFTARKRGLAGSPRLAALQQAHERDVSSPTLAELAQVLVARMQGMPRERGLGRLDELIAAVTDAEATRFSLPAGQAIPQRLVAIVRRSLDADMKTLVESGVIRSAEVLARFIPQLTSWVHATAFGDATLARIVASICATFVHCRSQLPFRLQAQVRIDDLPWVKALRAHRSNLYASRLLARDVLREVARVAIVTFPHGLLPSRLVEEMRSLVWTAGLDVPLVNEPGADIFTSKNAEELLRAAQVAGKMLEGTLYESYYDIPYARVMQMEDFRDRRHATRASAALGQLCSERAMQDTSTSLPCVVYNGRMVEQEQILTTHNLASLFDALDLVACVGPFFGSLCQRIFTHVCRRLQMRATDGRAPLKARKNTACAWRQTLFFLSLMPRKEVAAFLSWADEHLRNQRPDFSSRFCSVLRGLEKAADNEPRVAPFLAWSPSPFSEA